MRRWLLLRDRHCCSSTSGSQDVETDWQVLHARLQVRCWCQGALRCELLSGQERLELMQAMPCRLLVPERPYCIRCCAIGHSLQYQEDLWSELLLSKWSLGQDSLSTRHVYS